MSNPKILLVEDEEDLRDMIKRRLEAQNYEVAIASNGREGLDRAQENVPDLILLDVMMADMDGYTMYLELKKYDALRSVPVVVLTAKPGMQELFELEGVSAYLLKPFDPEELQQAISKAIGRS